MAGQTLAAADAILKDLYVGPVVEQINQKTYMLDQVERDSDYIDATGRRAIVPLHTGRNRGRGGRAAGGTLPNAGRQSYAAAIIHITYQYAGVEIDDAAIQASTSNEGAFLSILDGETKGCANDLKKDMQRQIYGTGDGLLATLTAETASGKVLTVDSVQYLQIGDPVDLLVKSTGATTNGVVATTIVARSASAKTVELAAAVAGAVSTTYGLYVASDRNEETNGLRNIIAQNRTLHELNSETAGNEYWNAAARKAGKSATETAVAGESVFEQLADDVGASGNGEVEAFLTTRGIRRRLADTYQSQKRFTNAEAVNVHGGYSAIMVNEVPVIADDDCPKTFAFGINKASFRLFQQAGGPGWLEPPQQNGGVFQLKDGTVAGSKVATWQAWFRWYVNLGNIAPNRNGVIEFCTDDNPS